MLQVSVHFEGDVTDLLIDGRWWRTGPRFTGWELEPGLHCLCTIDRTAGLLFWLDKENIGITIGKDGAKQGPYKPGGLQRMVQTEKEWIDLTYKIIPENFTPTVLMLKKACQDRSNQLLELGAYPLLGEMQLAWIKFTQLGDFEAFLHWRVLVRLFNTSFCFMATEDRFRNDYFDVITIQLNQHPLDDLPVEETISLAREWHALCEEVGETELPKILESLGFVHLPDPEDLPTIVE